MVLLMVRPAPHLERVSTVITAVSSQTKSSKAYPRSKFSVDQRLTLPSAIKRPRWGEVVHERLKMHSQIFSEFYRIIESTVIRGTSHLFEWRITKVRAPT